MKQKEYEPCPYGTKIGEILKTYFSIETYEENEIINLNSQLCRNHIHKQHEYKCPYLIINDKGDIPYAYGRFMICEKHYRIQRMKEILS